MTEERSARQQLSDWVKSEIEGQTEINIPAITLKAEQAFKGNRRFIQQFVNETLHSIVYEVVRKVLADDRTIVGDAAVEDVKEHVRKRAANHSVFSRWFEHVGDRHVRLLDMTREELLVAAELREKRGTTELKYAALWRTIANGLEGGQMVGAKYKPEEIERMFSGITHA